MRRPAILAIATALVLAPALAGCVPVEPVPTSAPAATETSASTPTPTPTAPDAAPVIPPCDALLPLDIARALFSESTEFFGELPAAEFEGHFDIPQLAAVLGDAEQSRLCRWGVPESDGVFSVVAAVISPADRATLESALATAGFTSTTEGDVTTAQLEEDGDLSPNAATHIFTGEFWILSDSGSLSTTAGAAESALTAVQMANP